MVQALKCLNQLQERWGFFSKTLLISRHLEAKIFKQPLDPVLEFLATIKHQKTKLQTPVVNLSL